MNVWIWFYGINIRAQSIQIDSITIDENQNLLKIAGALSANPGIVSVNGKNLKLIQWGLTGAQFSLPFDGPGSSGPIKIILYKDTIVGWSIQEWFAHIQHIGYSTSPSYLNTAEPTPPQKTSEWDIYFRN